MAGNGPAPKMNRQRRSEPTRGEWIDLPPLDKPVLPPLPPGKWKPETRKVWKAWREDPVTAKYSPADIAYALDTIGLRNRGLAKYPNEVRLRSDALGLTPKGKQDRRWRVGGEAEVHDLPAERERKLRAV